MSTDIDALIARLRKVQAIGKGWGLPILDGESLDITCDESAASLAAQRARIAELEQQYETVRGLYADKLKSPYLSDLIVNLANDRDEWKRQHENLLAVKSQDNSELVSRAERAEAALAEAQKRIFHLEADVYS